jgi:hypothetical protein
MTRYLSPEPLLQSSGFARVMLGAGHQAPTYSYAASNPMQYLDPDGLALVIHPVARWIYSKKAIKALEDAIKLLDEPICECALTKGTGNSEAPWKNRDILVSLDPFIGLTGLDGIAPGFIIYVSTSLLDESEPARSIANNIGDESGHLRFPYIGHYPEKRFRSPENHCGIDIKDDGCPCD